MIELNIPGKKTIDLVHLVCDVNGTLALDGKLLDGIATKLSSLKDRLQIHLITADTHGKQNTIDERLKLQAVRLKSGNEHLQKAQFVQQLGAEKVVAVGQGANDAEMLKEAIIGICVISHEGTATSTLMNADIIVPDPYFALDLLDNPLRMIATLRR